MPVVDLSFPLVGRELPVDHGYALFSAISKLIPAVHEENIGIHPIVGTLIGGRKMMLNARSRLVLRLDHTKIGALMPLAGEVLNIDGYLVRVGVPDVALLKPAPSCRSRLVTIRGYTEPIEFLGAVRRQLEEAGIGGTPRLLCRSSLRPGLSPYIRRTVQIKDKNIVGYAVEITDLSPEDSIRLQEVGVGGRRHMGCGIFNPVRGVRR